MSFNSMKFLNFFITILFCFLVMTLSGCAAGHRAQRAVERDIALPLAEKKAPVRHEGSLWQDNGPLSELFINPKARRVGDIVTINIVESSSATNNATTKTGRESSLSAGIEQMFGMENWYATKYPKYSKYFNPFSQTAVKGSIKSDFDGSGTTTRSGTLTAQITARITAVLPNGNLKIVGSRQIAVNNETQLIILTGIVRPRDISPDNIVLSTYIADARISYSGTGIVDDRQQPGWLANILNKIWPF